MPTPQRKADPPNFFRGPVSGNVKANFGGRRVVIGQSTARSSRFGFEFRATAAALAATLTLSTILPASASTFMAGEQPVAAKLNKNAPKVDASKATDSKISESTIQIDIGDDEGSKAFSNYTGPHKIPCTVWAAPNPKVALLCIHGFGMHKGGYNAFARQMVPEGTSVYAIDVRGFGSWVARGVNRIDFNGTLTDIGASLKEMRRLNPGVPIIILGESMGGAIALKAAATYPDLVDGLVSSVPAGDRFDSADSKIGIVSHVLAHGFNSPIDVGPAVTGSATKKESLRQAWLHDPLARTQVTANELIDFKKFMNSSFEFAPSIKKIPVLFVQGSNDKLVRPAGTWKLFHSIGSPRRQIVLSATAEHLIFEAGQFSDQDLGFVERWITKNVAPIVGTHIKHAGPIDLVEGPDSQAGPETATVPQETTPVAQLPYKKGGDNDTGSTSTNTTKVATTSGTTTPSGDVKPAGQADSKTAISYWIELKRNGKVFRCNNKTSFKSGDAIRFHVMSESDGFAYVVLQQGSTGNSAVLFPTEDTGKNNFIRKNQDYPLPYQDWLAFDANPGLEKVRILFSQSPLKLDKMKQAPPKTMVAYVSPDMTGAKDLVGTRMQLSWNDPDPIIMPDEIASADHTHGSQVRLVFDNPNGTFAVDVALLHK